ncbi:LLM class flavin-dependent oxidoreductase [Dactylosporangium salmoneum]|uniref:TIGR03619 family F420-dependent LLM class oxidoreductase n=1 Tax=Dactylosporangium salmoneum TaxID=53361 RepID=A0ABN3FPS6_9ACTN
MDIGIACAFESKQAGSLQAAIRTAAVAAEDEGFASWWGLGDREVAQTSSHDATLGLYCVARATRRIRLGLAGEVLSVRAAAVRAKQLASLDWFAGGRLELGIDLGGPPADLLEPGAAVSDPVGRSLDRLAAMEALWTQRRGAVSSPTVSFSGAIANPKPVGERCLKVHLRDAGTPVLRRVLEARGRIDGWAAWRVDPAALDAALAALLDALGADAGPIRRTWFVDAHLMPASRGVAADAGIDELVAVFDRIPEPAELREVAA